jgi:predicted ATP-dependent endonuclease of OLD family
MKKSQQKEFSPTFNLILFEEPEAFLHPNQQENMAYQLRTLSKLSDHQVFITSHSPNFLDKAHENLLEIIRVKRDFGITCIHQPTQEILSVFLGREFNL